uniref:Ig-like domain-containing protein n=1 Tax=Gopherus agassizii TaxID=38772 RepID=A0A452I0Q7_9SAUR
SPRDLLILVNSLPLLSAPWGRVPVSPPHLTISAAGSWAAIGDVVVIQCESPRGSAPILYQFHHEGATLGNRTVSSRGPGSLALNVTSERDSGTYSCEADNGMPSLTCPDSLSVPVSPPHLTISAAGSWAAIGDVVVIQCESPRGSAPILYQFHHEGATLGNRTVSSRGPGSLALNVTSERDSGTYSCEADNGMASGPQHSDPFHLSVLGMPSPHALLGIGGAGSLRPSAFSCLLHLVLVLALSGLCLPCSAVLTVSSYPQGHMAPSPAPAPWPEAASTRKLGPPC